MKAIRVKMNQTIFDVALEQYGTLQAVGGLIANNPELTNDSIALAKLGIEAISSQSYYLDVMLEPGQLVMVDMDSDLIRGNVTKQLERDITTFDL